MDERPEEDLSRLTRRGFLAFGASAAVGLGGLTWLNLSPQDSGIRAPLRKVLEVNHEVTETLFNPTRLTKTYPASAAPAELRSNGTDGLPDDFDADTWQLHLSGAGGKHSLKLDEIRALPRTEQTIELRCVEGWTAVASWAGVKVQDLLRRYPVQKESPYVSLTTPDEGYFVGIDTPSILHPQTLLAYELNGADLAPEHGAPLRLVIPVKYGVKWLKRVGNIRFVDQRPDDFWTQRGYDWYCGL